MIVFITILLIILIGIYKDLINRKKFFPELSHFFPEGQTVLDFGSGSCLLQAFLKNRNKVVNLDIYNGCPDTYIYDGYTIPFPDNSFDISFCMHVLHHIPHHKQILQELIRVTKRRIIIVEEYYNSYISKLITSAHFLFFKQPMAYIKNIHSPNEWISLLNGGNYYPLHVRSFINPTPRYVIIKDL
tara:strand:- start:873 stop:1430 length:558 start_codon:yes stop_codon:yes gene_type:complete